jgi:two-component system OmpR family sensor kinase
MQALLPEVVTLIQKNTDADQRQWNLILPQAPWPLPKILGDWDLLFLAIYNLTDNALKYTRRGDTIEIRARQDDGYLVVEVADTGIGIPTTALPHVWEELYRGENSQSVAGSGLGLALVKAIVELHKGKVTLASRSETGTNVTIQLPITTIGSDSM